VKLPVSSEGWTVAAARGSIGGRRFAGSRVHRSGPDPQRVLLVGDRSFVGDSTPEGPGFVAGVADRIAARTGRGLDLDVMWDLAPSLQAVAAATQAWRLWRYESVIVLVREAELHDADRWWSGRLTRIARRVIPELAEASRVLVVRLGRPAGGTAARQAPRASAPVSSISVPLTPGGVMRSLPERIDEIADRVVTLLGTAAARAELGEGGTADERRAMPEPEEDRQRAVDRTKEALGGLTPDLERVVLLARNTFDVPFAQVNLLDHGRVRTLAFVGGPGDAAVQPICSITVRGSGPTVIADTWDDRRLDDNPHVHGEHPVRFYAAHPIESLDGYRIGTLCVFDLVPHEQDEVDFGVLRDLALLAEAEISTLI
jgi:hypothetical protein